MNRKKGVLVTLFLVVFSLGLFGAGSKEEGPKSNDFTTVYSDEVSTLNYLISSTENEHIMFTNMIDSLVEYNKFGVMQPGLAVSWDVSPDGLVYTMKIRKNVSWYKNDGSKYAPVTAQDWVDAAEYLLDSANASPVANVMYSVVKNAKAYFDGEISDFSKVGVKAVDDYTLEYSLNNPVPYFLSMLTYVTFLPMNGQFQKEMGEMWGTDNTTILYNGAFIMDSFEPQSSRVLVKNKGYWDAANVYIPRLIYKYNKEAGTLAPELFLRGEISEAFIPSSSIDSWMNDPEKEKQVHPRRASAYTYFYALNFNPKFEAEYQPENWKIAVNNKNFREAFFHGLDREGAMRVSEPYNPRRRLSGTITPAYFANVDGQEYTLIGKLAEFANTESFDKIKAVQYKEAAMAELNGKVTFPVIVKMPYNSSGTENALRVQVVEQQLEGLLGTDFIDIVPVAYPPTGFLSATRRAGNFAFQLVNWGPDYADPETYTDPFKIGGTYNKPDMAEEYIEANGLPGYENMINMAKAETTDMSKRYNLFAAAEAFLIDEAFVIPFSTGGGGFQASRLKPFSSPYAPFGMSNLKFKGQTVLDNSLSTSEYADLEADWKAERISVLESLK